MTVLFVILISLACIALGFVILVQNPKGGGLASNIAGVGNQFMGVKQTTDVLEKGTWVCAAIIAALCIFSTIFVGNSSDNSKSNKVLQNINTTAPAPTKPAANPPVNTAPVKPSNTHP